MTPGGSPWSPQQRRWLQALGHAVLRVGGDGSGPGDGLEPEGADEAVRPAASRGGRVLAGDVAPRRAPAPAEAGHGSGDAASAIPGRTPGSGARPVPGAGADIGPGADAAPAAGIIPAAAARPGPRRPARLPDRLQLAMLRASGLDPADPAAQEAMAQWPVDRLRGDAAAKRAFWPQLRALRRRPS